MQRPEHTGNFDDPRSVVGIARNQRLGRVTTTLGKRTTHHRALSGERMLRGASARTQLRAGTVLSVPSSPCGADDAFPSSVFRSSPGPALLQHRYALLTFKSHIRDAAVWGRSQAVAVAPVTHARPWKGRFRTKGPPPSSQLPSSPIVPKAGLALGCTHPHPALP